MNDNKKNSYYEKMGKRIRRCRVVKEGTQTE